MHSVFKVILFIICTFFLNSGHTQDKVKVDSARRLLEKGKLSKKDELTTYHWLSMYSKSPIEKIRYGNLTSNLAKDLVNHEYIIKADLRLGVSHRLLGNLGKATEYLFRSANSAYDHENFQPLLSNIYAEISTCYTLNGDSENAMLYGSKAIDILRKTGKKKELALNLLNMGYDHYVIGNYDSALNYYAESEPILAGYEMKFGLAYIMGNRALVYWKKGDVEKAKNDLTTAIRMLEPFEDRFAMADYYNKLSDIYIEENDLENAILTASKGLDMAKLEGLKEQARDASYLLLKIHEGAGRYEDAMYYQTQYYAYKDSIQNLETTKLIADLRTEYEVGQMQTEVDQLTEQKSRYQIIIIAAGVIIFVVLGFTIIRRI